MSNQKTALEQLRDALSGLEYLDMKITNIHSEAAQKASLLNGLRVTNGGYADTTDLQRKIGARAFAIAEPIIRAEAEAERDAKLRELQSRLFALQGCLPNLAARAAIEIGQVARSLI